MSERVNAFVVILKNGVGEERANQLKAAMELLDGVACVQPVEADLATQIGREQARTDLSIKLWNALQGESSHAAK